WICTCFFGFPERSSRFRGQRPAPLPEVGFDEHAGKAVEVVADFRELGIREFRAAQCLPEFLNAQHGWPGTTSDSPPLFSARTSAVAGRDGPVFCPSRHLLARSRCEMLKNTARNSRSGSGAVLRPFHSFRPPQPAVSQRYSG